MRGHLNFHRTNRSFELHKWPKKHQFCVEQCYFLNIKDVLGHLNILHQQYPSADFLSEYPWIKIVRGRGGFTSKLWFACFTCGKRCENLYRPPYSRSENWACRICHNLIYSSQRYGRKNELRQILTPRKRRSRQKSAVRQNRIFARREAKQQKLLKNQEEPIVDKNFIPMMKEMEKFAADGNSLTIRAENKTAPSNPVTKNQEYLQARIEEAIPGALEVLRQIAETSPLEWLRERAIQVLHKLGICLKEPQKEIPTPKAVTLSPDEIKRILAVMAETSRKIEI